MAMKNWILVSVSILAISAAVLHGAEHNVKTKTGTRVILNNEMEHDALETVDMESLQRSGPRPVIVTKTFKPPANSNKVFARFPGRKTHVDILDNMDGFRPFRSSDTSTSVKVERIFMPDTAAEFPLQVEGNIEEAGGGGESSDTASDDSDTASAAEYWAVQVPRNKKIIALQGVPLYTTSGETTSGSAYAYSNLEPQEGVMITFTVRDDKGALEGGAPFGSDKTSAVMAPDGIPVAGVPFMKELPEAHEGAKTYILTASATGYQSAVAYIEIIHNGRWMEHPQHMYEGYDPIPDPADPKERPQLVVGKDKTSQASQLVLGQAVENVLIDVTANATVQPPQTSDAKTNTSFTGANKGGADATASKGETTYAEMKVSVMKEQPSEYELKFIFVKDTPGDGQEQHSGELTRDERASLFDDASKVWMDQAVYSIRETQGDPEVWTLSQYQADIVTVEAAKKIVDMHAEPPVDEVYVYVFWSLRVLGQTGQGGFARWDERIVVIDTGATPQTLAHELGHVFGLRGDYPAIGARSDDLMAYGYGGMRIHKYQADLVRKENK